MQSVLDLKTKTNLNADNDEMRKGTAKFPTFSAPFVFPPKK